MAARRFYAKGAATRQKILDAALEVIADQGSSHAYVSEVAQRAGVTHAGLMHYFSSREALYQEILRARDEHDHDLYAEAPTGIDGFLAVIEHNQQVPGLVQLYAEYSSEAAAGPEHPSRGFFRERYSSLRESLERDVRIAQELGEMGPLANPRDIAEMMIAAADGLQVQWLLDREVDMLGQLQALWRALSLASFNAGPDVDA